MNEDQDLWTFCDQALRRFADETLWVRRLPQGRRERFTYGQIRNAVGHLAAQLREMGAAPGTRVGIMAPNGPEWGAAALAVWRLGGVLTPLHVGNSDEELRIQSSALSPSVVLRCGPERAVSHTVPVELNFSAAPELSSVPVDPGTEALRIYTSGSTGRPKMVRLSHRNIVSNVRGAMQCDLQTGPGDRFLSLLPLSHTFELTAGFLLPLAGGAAIVLPRTIAAGEIIEAMKEEQVTIIVAVPRLFRNLMQGLEKRFAERGAWFRVYRALLAALPERFRRIANAPIRRHFGAPRAWVSGGARLDPEISRFFRALGLPLRQGYGLTETSPVASVQRDFDPLTDSIGQPIEHVEIRIHEPDASGSGELLVRGPNVMLGYVDEVQTREAMLGDWFRTGDIGQIVPGGIVLTGRRKRLIVTEAGKNVYPEELEFLLERYPQVREAGVVEADLQPAAVLAIEGEDAAGKARAVLKAFNARVSSHNRITRFALVEQLPRTPLGKVAIKELPELFARHEVRS